MVETYLAYVDESGDSQSFVLAAVLVPASEWLLVHDRLRDFRRRLSQEVGFRMRHELHATEIVSNGGPWRALNVAPRRRFGIYRAALKEIEDMGRLVRTVGVVIPNRRDTRLAAPALEEAWEILLERLRTFSFYNSSKCILVPDEGARGTVRRLARRKRRFGYAPAAFGGTARKVPFVQLVDDPFHHDSRESYLLQWADLTAYAAFRRIMPRPSFPQGFWDDLGDARLADANEIERTHRGSQEPPGLIVWPSRLKPGSPV